MKKEDKRLAIHIQFQDIDWMPFADVIGRFIHVSGNPENLDSDQILSPSYKGLTAHCTIHPDGKLPDLRRIYYEDIHEVDFYRTRKMFESLGRITDDLDRIKIRRGHAKTLSSWLCRIAKVTTESSFVLTIDEKLVAIEPEDLEDRLRDFRATLVRKHRQTAELKAAA